MASGKDLAWMHNRQRVDFDEMNEVMEDFRELMCDISWSRLRRRHGPRAEEDEELLADIRYAYGSVDPTTFLRSDPSGEGGVWEPIGKCFLSREDGITPGHITWPSGQNVIDDGHRSPYLRIVEFFPHGFTQDDSRAVFGELNCGRVYGPYNAMTVADGVHQSFSGHYMVLLPKADTAKGGRAEYTLRVLPWKKFECKHPGRASTDLCEWHVYYHRLDGIHLEFRNGFRPAKQYVFYHYLMGLMKYVRDWQERNEKLDAGERQQFLVRQEDRWPPEQDKLIKRSALEHIILRFSIDYEKIADIIEPHVIPGSVVSSAEEVEAEDLFAAKLAGWDKYDRDYRNVQWF